MTAEHKVIGGVALLTILIVGGGVLFFSKGSESSVPVDQIIAKNGLHWHPKLTITIEGKKQEIPSGLGMAGKAHQELHTHEEARRGAIQGIY